MSRHSTLHPAVRAYAQYLGLTFARTRRIRGWEVQPFCQALTAEEKKEWASVLEWAYNEDAIDVMVDHNIGMHNGRLTAYDW